MKAKLLAQFILNQAKIMATQAEIAQALQTMASNIDRVGRESTVLVNSNNDLKSQVATLTQQVADLSAQAANSVAVTPELQAAVDAITASVQAINAVFP